MTARAAELLGNIAGVLADGTPTVSRARAGAGAVVGDAASSPAPFAATASAACASACAADDACVAWDFAAAANASSACRFFATLLSFAPSENPDACAGHKGFKRAGVSAAIYTGSTDIETECDGFYTYDRRELKYDGDAIRSAAAALLAPL